MQEDTRHELSRPECVQILDSVKPWEHVRLRGEDIKKGAWLARMGERIDFGTATILAASGRGEVSVRRRPVVGVLATGSELVEPGEALAPGSIYESNRVLLAALLQQTGAEPRVYPLVPDAEEATRQALSQAFEECDAVVTSGGVSVGEHDLVKPAFAALGGTMDFWKVSIKPGKPFGFGLLRERCWFGLPGNPVSALVTYLLLARPAVLNMQGAGRLDLPSLSGTLVQAIRNPGDRCHYVRVRLDEDGGVHPAGVQASHRIAGLTGANGLVCVPAGASLAAGANVAVLLWGWA